MASRWQKYDRYLVPVILDLSYPSLVPANNLIAALSYSANGSEVETVIIDGEITMENREIRTMDEERILFETQKIMDNIRKAL